MAEPKFFEDQLRHARRDLFRYGVNRYNRNREAEGNIAATVLTRIEVHEDGTATEFVGLAKNCTLAQAADILNHMNRWGPKSRRRCDLYASYFAEKFDRDELRRRLVFELPE